MEIRDRGKIKWAPAAFLPEQVGMMRKIWAEDKYEQKPIVDSYLLTEYAERINYAMEYNLTVHFRVWFDGLTSVIIGNVHHVDGHKRLYLVETDDGNERIPFDAVVGVEVEDA